jgi:hypothetical protein
VRRFRESLRNRHKKKRSGRKQEGCEAPTHYAVEAFGLALG